VLEFEGNRALVRANPQDKKIVIQVNGPSGGRARLLAIIRSDFQRIHTDMQRLNVVSSISLSEDPSVTVPFDELQALANDGIPVTHRVVHGKATVIDVRKTLSNVEVVGGTVRPVRLFGSYSHRDEEFREELANHLKIFERMELIEQWHDRRIVPGDAWRGEIDIHLTNADIVLLLVSPDFVASDYCCDVEMKAALSGRARVIPIIVRDCKWDLAEFASLQILPRNGRPVQQSRPRDRAWRQIADELESIIKTIVNRTPLT
jgi:internalin A